MNDPEMFPDALRTCLRCRRSLPVSEFYRNSGRFDARCKACKCADASKFFKQRIDSESPEEKALRLERQRIRQREYRERHGDAFKMRQRLWHVRRTFGLTEEEYRQRHEVQGQACAVCRDPIVLGENDYIDHCHATGRIRGILCNNCNAGLGFFKDDRTRLFRALAYLFAQEDGVLFGEGGSVDRALRLAQ